MTLVMLLINNSNDNNRNANDCNNNANGQETGNIQ